MAAVRPPFRRLLVHVDATASRHPALTRALRAARGHRVQFRLVDVCGPDLDRSALRNFVHTAMRARLNAAAARVQKAGHTASVALLTGDPATALVEAAITWRADVLLRSHAVRRPQPYPIGPVDSHVLRRCPCPVWLVTPRQSTGESVIVAAVDPEPSDPSRHALSVAVARQALAIGARQRAQVHLVHAWTAFGQELVASHATAGDLAAYEAACRDHAEGRLEALVREVAPTPGVRVHLIEGTADHVLTQLVTGRRASLVVLGTVGRTGLAGLIMGNTAERVLRHVRCSVLALKPDGFGASLRKRTPS
jgi:universal stress protein E